MEVRPCFSMYRYFIPLLLTNNIPLYRYTILSIHSSINGQLGCFYSLAIMRNAAVNIHVQVSVWTYVFMSAGYVPRSKTVGSYGNYV